MEVCCICSTHEFQEKALCGHLYCRKCLLEYFKECVSQNPYAKILCKECKGEISMDLVYDVFGGKLEFSMYHNSQEVDECSLCLDSHKIQDFVFLECNHAYCSNCFRLFIANKLQIVDFDGEGIRCPECPEVIPVNFLSQTLEKSQFDEYLHFLKLKAKSSINVQQFVRWCIFCKKAAICEENDTSFYCSRCKSFYCIRCKQAPHDFNNCEIVDQQLDSLKSKQLLLPESLEGHNVLKCPVCSNAISKEDGCNFIKCPWDYCKSTYFCALCLEILEVISTQKSDHFSHYKESGPFSQTCNSFSQIPSLT